MLTVLYFAWLRERIGTDAERVEVPASVTTLGQLAGWLAARSPAHAEAFADMGRIRAALDQQFAPFDTPIAGARAVAFFPPVTGG